LLLDVLNLLGLGRILVQLLGNDELFVADLFSRFVISGDYSLDSDLGALHTSLVVSDQKHMLLVIVIRLGH